VAGRPGAEYNPSVADSSETTFSFIVPVHNEQEGLENFHGRLKAVADKLGEPYEIIFVNDGSQDATAQILRRLADADPRVRAVEFSRNFGHQVAVTAGYDFAVGKAVISLDSDCQHPPELIPDLVARWREGYEVVYTVRQDTHGISAVRRAIGRLTYAVIRWASGADLTDQADFRLVDRKAADALRELREHARFIRGLVRWIGFRQVSVPYTAERRAKGRSSYSLKQLAGMSMAGVFNFSVLPLRLVSTLGGVLAGAALAYAVLALVLWAFRIPPGGWWSLTMLVLGLSGVQFLFLGILGEYLGRIFEETKGRPLYVVRDKIGYAPPKPAPPPGATPEPARRERGNITIFT